MSYVLSSSPHVRSGETTSGIMLTVIAMLVPSGLWAGWIFGRHALYVILVSVASCVAIEYVSQRWIFKKPVRIGDGSAALTGLLMAYCCPPDLPLWQAVVGAFFAIFVTKECFGGLGFNIFNPALVGRAALLGSFPVAMTAWQIDGVTTATPLGLMPANLPKYLDLLIGNVPGSIGEVSKLLLVVGGCVLLARRIITWHVPVTFIGTVIVLSVPFGQDPIAQALSGGVILGAFFMATDYVTGPLYARGQLIFGVGCGILTVLIRNLGGFPEGVCYAILLMNILVPLIDRITRPRIFGARA